MDFFLHKTFFFFLIRNSLLTPELIEESIKNLRIFLQVFNKLLDYPIFHLAVNLTRNFKIQKG